MDIQEHWEKALKNTEIIRPRVTPLQTSASTDLPYILLAESVVNIGDTVVRKGEVMVEKPSIILPSNLPQFEGFEPEDEPAFHSDSLINFLLVRGVRFPSLKYNNKTFSLDVFEGRLQSAIDHYKHELEKVENISTGLIVGPEDSWQFSILIFIGSLMLRQADKDLRKLFNDFRKKKPLE